MKVYAFFEQNAHDPFIKNALFRLVIENFPRKFEYFQGKVLISLALEKVEFLQQPYSFKDK